MTTTQKWSSSWKASVQPRKQRLYNYNAPLHVKSKMICSHLSKDLQKKYKTRSLRVIKDDVVKIMRGDFKNKQGKVIRVDTKKKVVFVEVAKRKRMDGSEVFVPINASNLQIIELNLNNPLRFGKKAKTKQEAQNSEISTEKHQTKQEMQASEKHQTTTQQNKEEKNQAKKKEDKTK